MDDLNGDSSNKRGRILAIHRSCLCGLCYQCLIHRSRAVDVKEYDAALKVAKELRSSRKTSSTEIVPLPGKLLASGELLMAAFQRCTKCYGLGYTLYPGPKVCNCALRGIFKVCYQRYNLLRFKQESALTHLCYRKTSVRTGFVWCRQDEEYIADFYLLTRRSLSLRDLELWKLYFEQGRPWGVCAAVLRTNRGNFYHGVYKIEQTLGRLLWELEPYPLFPLYGYFH